jgi:uncharacterized repeat protein (TIGR03803 family)
MSCTRQMISSARSRVERALKNPGPTKTLCGFLFLVATVVVSTAQTFTSLLSFNGTNGANPYYVYLVQRGDGKLYGTTYTDANGYGTLFKISTGGTLTTIYNFCSQASCADGANPAAGVVLDTNGSFYGTTSVGGAYNGGTVFRITAGGKLTTIYNFCAQPSCADGSSPEASLVLASNGKFYGTTTEGGTGGGTVFEITPAGTFTLIHTFNGDGANPHASLVQGANGNFYGTTSYGGVYNEGTIFEMAPSGKLTSLYSFCVQSACADGSAPYAGLVQASNGNFYGTTTHGGTSDEGTVFEITPAGKLTTLYSFFCDQTGCPDGDAPNSGLIQATDGNLYGTTDAGGGNAGGGTIFQVTLGGALTTLYNFCATGNGTCFDGSGPVGGLLQDTNGELYGTTYSGGTGGGFGTVFGLSTGLGPFVKTLPGSGKVGARVIILGTNLTGATSVSFNGTAATFTVASSSEITTTVPTGATMGPVKVTTPGGTLLSNVAFRVTPQLLSFSPSSGPVGTSVVITGVSLTKTNRVTFGGVAAASFTVNSDTQVTATAPTGAKTGKLSTVTSGGTATSTGTFTVTP